MKPQTYAQQRAESLPYFSDRVFRMTESEFWARIRKENLGSRVTQRRPASAPSAQHSMVTQ